VNNVSLIGTLVEDPEPTVSETGGAACVLRIVLPRRAVTGQRQPGVLYVDVMAFGAEAKMCATDLRSGSKVGVSGMLERSDSLGQAPRRSRWEVHAHQVEFLDSADAPPSRPS
jgi:single-stranded DNA-binding protein